MLMVEDAPDDADLLLHALGGEYSIEHARVETVDALRRELAHCWDVLVTDYSLPSMTALDAIATSKSIAPDLPVIVVSGTIGEEAAVSALHAGADDFVVKGRFARLGPALERARRDAALRASRREAERERAIADAKYRSIIETTKEALWLLDENDRISFINGRMAALTEYRSSELVGRYIFDLVRDDQRLAFEEVLRSNALLRSDQRELALKRADGSDLWLLVDVTPFRTPEGKRETLVMAMDITGRRALEAQLRQSQKMEAVGNLAGGIAHDFNNLLSVILSYSEFVLEELGPGDSLRADIEEIKRAGERAAELTRQLLAYSRGQLLEPRNIDLHEVVAGLERLLQRIVGEDRALDILSPGQLTVVRADPSSMEQVIVNLVVNARDAMPNGGKITIGVTSVELDAGDAASQPDVAPGRYVRLAVTDDGVGLDDATRARVFEPFFTTKERGKGTGLGLATVFGIVKQSGGHISVRSGIGQGTTMEVYLPGVTAPAEALDIPKAARVELRGSETVLLVEDEDQVRVMLRTALRRYGYNVLDASNGAEALALSERFNARIDLLIADMVMPLVSGRELADRLRRMRSDLRVLYLSGYTDSSTVHHESLDVGTAFIQKPVIPETVAAKVRSLLDGR